MSALNAKAASVIEALIDFKIGDRVMVQFSNAQTLGTVTKIEPRGTPYKGGCYSEDLVVVEVDEAAASGYSASYAWWASAVCLAP